ncbi:unnamed protein product, partial [Rotaria socialis]
NEEVKRDLTAHIEQKNRDKQNAEQNEKIANDAVEQAEKALEALEIQMNTLRDQLAQLTQDK